MFISDKKNKATAVKIAPFFQMGVVLLGVSISPVALAEISYSTAISRPIIKQTAIPAPQPIPKTKSTPTSLPANIADSEEEGSGDFIDEDIEQPVTPQTKPPKTTTTVVPSVTPTNSTASSTNRKVVINPAVLLAADDVPPVIEHVPLGTVSPITLQKFVRLIDTVRQEYIYPVNDETLFENAMTGMLAELDPYSEYLDPQAYNNLRLFTEGDMGSIGVKVTFDPISQQWVVREVLADSPAAKAGIGVNDYVHQIGENKLQDSQTQQDIDQLLSGIAGTQVKLVVSNQGRRKHSLILQRSLRQQQPIHAKIINDVAIVHIPIFQSNTQQQVIDALTRLNQPFSAIVIDVRNNPGGVLSAASDIASLFMQDKNVVQVHGRQGIQEIIKTRATPRLVNVPLVVLQNRYSASASEVLASSLQENGRAKILGETSYGKGSIQSVIPLMTNDAVKLTVAHYYSGKGKKIDGVGIVPDFHLVGGELTWEDQVLNYVISQVLSQPQATRYILQNPVEKP